MTTTALPPALAEGPSSARLGALTDALAASAAADDLLDVAVRTVASPVGDLLLAATPVGLVRVAFTAEDHDAVLDDLARRVSPRVLRAPTRLDAVARELDEYFEGRRERFDVTLDRRLSAGFRLAVLTHLTDVPFGRTESYAEVAAALDNPKAVRAVGSACATNPIPVVVPCHRVLRSDGSLGGYLGGLDAKTTLLRLEGAVA
ncbi:methylated-DNA--[protein]-cysteine S-methyltransferase [Sanguibacter sp. HDW7]|uniref:methylated-DNA--[protein]-cysteine S-methyltransferase n=1 Tax=Sanguibacter sp. HDW7 TaxID=2714931 RepID=UPI00140AC105|nr:methylated-DNA--[protein]-cysteine S-methyltransferase [Sanguibacter sp. HDW7]QIK83042.1 methylated-DNA--[protein]-cysteine S-methyltransferase [Sanguibacter sp. HDW7]